MHKAFSKQYKNLDNLNQEHFLKANLYIHQAKNSNLKPNHAKNYFFNSDIMKFIQVVEYFVKLKLLSNLKEKMLKLLIEE